MSAGEDPAIEAGDRAPAVPARDAARRVARRLREAGFQALFAGGCVRDGLLGLEPDDYDVATDATPEDVQRIFPQARGVGEAFGVMLVRSDRHVFEIATFRTDLSYADGRRPTAVRFASAREDAERRDFTINGLFEDPESREVIDYVGGRRDLESKVLRAIGDPSRRFAEDHLRLLRAVRFAARFGLAIEPLTAAAMRAAGAHLDAVARERIGLEVRRMLEDPARATARDLLEQYAFDGYVLGDEHRRSSEERIAALGASADPILSLAAWGLDRAGPGSEVDLDLGRIDRWRLALCLSNDETDALRDIATCRKRLRRFGELRQSERKRLAVRPGFLGALRLASHDFSSLASEVDAWRSGLEASAIAPGRLIDGHDLLRRGLVAGPRFRDLLEAVYDAQLDGRVATRGEALSLLEALIARGE